MVMERISAKEYLDIANKRTRNKQKSKYNNKIVEVDGHKFHSQAEANYYLNLKLRKKANEIKSFRLQPKYLLQESFEKDGKKYRAIYYVADFEVTHNDGSIEVIDVKGVQTKVFRLKLRLFHKQYPYKITLVKEKRNGEFVEIT